MTTFANVQVQMENVSAARRHSQNIIAAIDACNKSGKPASNMLLSWFDAAEEKLVDAQNELREVHSAHMKALDRAVFR